MKKILLLLSVIFILVGCGNEKKFVELVVVYNQPLKEGKFPDHLKHLVIPFSASDCSTDFFLKPISIARLDISNKTTETNAWFFEKQVEVTKESATNWLGYFFTDSLVPKYATLPAKRKVDEDFLKRYIDKLKAKYNVFILAEDSELDEFDGVPVLHNPKDVNKKIQEVACKLKGDKIFVLVNPKVLNEMQEEQPAEPPQDDQYDQSGEETTETTNATTTQTTQTTTTTTVIHKKPVKTTTITVGNTHFTKRGGNYYSDYARYEGGVENGKAHGQGTMIFTRSHLIPVPPYSAKKITARKGYKLAGRFNNGYFVSGKLYDAGGRKIKSIYIGR